MSLAAIPLLTLIYCMGLFLLYIAQSEFRVAPGGGSRRFRSDIDWIVPAIAGSGLHAFVAWGLLAA